MFQKHILEDLRGESIADDIHDRGVNEHDENLTMFFERCLETGIRLNEDRLNVGLSMVEFKDHPITRGVTCGPSEGQNHQ